MDRQKDTRLEGQAGRHQASSTVAFGENVVIAELSLKRTQRLSNGVKQQHTKYCQLRLKAAYNTVQDIRQAV